MPARFERPALVSWVWAGVPGGVLMTRYAERRLGRDFLHYGGSIIRGKSFDENAIHLILRRHPGQEIVFVDGWTGKGMITTQLEESCRAFNARNGTALRPTLAVLADPAHCCSLYATREDFINPSCCLNSTICGLISRSVHNRSIIGPEDFHGARVYHEFAAIDQTACYLDTVSSWFSRLDNEISAAARALDAPQPPPEPRCRQPLPHPVQPQGHLRPLRRRRIAVHPLHPVQGAIRLPLRQPPGPPPRPHAPAPLAPAPRAQTAPPPQPRHTCH